MSFRILPAALVAFVAMFSTVHIFAQPLRPGATASAPGERRAALDTVRLVYDFEPGEAVTYRVVTHDTLFFHGANSFIRVAERSHIVTYRCDSIVRDGTVLTISYGGYAAREWLDTLPPVVRTANAWTDRTFTMLMYSDGRRIRLLTPNGAASVSPAGPFQPLLLPYLGEPWTYVGSSDIFELNHWLLDNSVPPVLFGGSVYRTVGARVDTFGVPTIELTFAETGRAKYVADNGNETTSIINGVSRVWFSPMLGFPVAGEQQGISNLTMRGPDGSEATGRQMIHTMFEMINPDVVTHSPGDSQRPDDSPNPNGVSHSGDK